MSKIEKYTNFAENVAWDNSHGYDQVNRNGNPDYDCSGLVCDAVDRAGIPVKAHGASYTGNMLNAFKACGFADVTSKVTLSSGKGLVRGDILLNVGHHTAIYCGDGKMVDARINENGKTTGGKPGDQTGHEIEVHAYNNHPWTHILRYTGKTSAEPSKTTTRTLEAAKSRNTALKGTYTTTANLNLRSGAGTNKTIIVTMPKGTKAICYGYYTEVNGTKWMLVDSMVGGKKYTGFCSKNYLK